MSFLENIQKPSDVKKLKRSELKDLATEIRELILEVVAKNGGHLASSLGVVDLTIALYYVFDIPKDKIIWDVGHQAYAHKILSGRKDRFHSLRTLGGISGFPKISESNCDAFTTGHSSTSISASHGIATAKKLKNENDKVISVIGDGSLTGGIAYEGLNQAGDSKNNQLIILNDNDMSISQNVGALSSFLSRTLSVNYLQNFRTQIGEFLKSLPKIGDDMYNLAKKSEDSLKTFVTPGMLFEAFNLDYFGPINGHNLNHLIDILKNIKALDEPVLLHVTTKKGKGYLFAEENPIYFHGVDSFDKDSGNGNGSSNKIPTYTEVFGDHMIKFAKKDKKIIAVTAAMPEGTGLKEFPDIFPDRFFDVGIAEQHGVTFAAGLSLEGFKPVVAIYSTFLQRAYDQILHDISIESIPVAFALDRGGIVGEDGPTHHGLFDFCYLRSIPNMVVMAPKDENELVKMMKTAIDYDKGPIAFRYPRGKGVGVNIDEDIQPLEIGKAEIIREGNDILLIGIGKTVDECMKSADILMEEGISATVVNARFVKPLDIDLINSLVKKIPYVVTVEDNVRQGGFGSAVLESLNDEGLCNFNLDRIGIKDQFVEHGEQKLLRAKYGIDTKAIVETVKKVLQLTAN